MRVMQWLALGMLVVSGCAVSGGGGATEQVVAAVGELGEDGEFVSERFGYAFRPPAEWEAIAGQVDGELSSLVFSSPEAQSVIQVNSGPPSDELAQAYAENGDQALEDFARELAQDADSIADPETQRTIELASGQTAVVMDVTAEGDRTGGRFLVAMGNDTVYLLTVLLGPDLPDFEQGADEVVESFRIL